MTEYSDDNGRHYQWFKGENPHSENYNLFVDVTAEEAPLRAAYIRGRRVVAFKITNELWYHCLENKLVTFKEIDDEPPTYEYCFGRLVPPP